MNSSHKDRPTDARVSCIILAGGEGKRVAGQDKGLIPFKQQPLIQRAIDNIKFQCDEIIISANRNLPEYNAYGYQVISDDADNYRGPMAGIAAALPHCLNEWALVIPCDMPYLPTNLIERLCFGRGQSNLCIADVEDHLQLAFLINKNRHPSLEKSLHNNQLKLMLWIKQQDPAIVHFEEKECFKNFNHASNFA